MEAAVAERFESIKPLIEEIILQMQQEVDRLGIQSVILKQPEDAIYRLEKDPYSGQFSLMGHWVDGHKQKLGNLLFHADGSFFVEHDVMKPHPRQSKWLVEAVNAWGKGNDIKVEPRLIEAL